MSHPSYPDMKCPWCCRILFTRGRTEIPVMFKCVHCLRLVRLRNGEYRKAILKTSNGAKPI
jgi:hypothetical protein